VIDIRAIDTPGPGGAQHIYELSGPSKLLIRLNFQKGGVLEEGVNGVTHEALMAVIIHRLQAFQAGPFACRENAIALTKLEESLMWLNKRTRDRMARGVEGKTVL